VELVSRCAASEMGFWAMFSAAGRLNRDYRRPGVLMTGGTTIVEGY